MSEEKREVKIHGIYKHFKNKYYIVEDVAYIEIPMSFLMTKSTHLSPIRNGSSGTGTATGDMNITKNQNTFRCIIRESYYNETIVPSKTFFTRCTDNGSA